MTINEILSVITGFLEGDFAPLNERYRMNSQIIHYYKEIIRYWSKLNFITNKTRRSLRNDETLTSLENARYLYSTYRMMVENAKLDAIKSELDIIPGSKIHAFLKRLTSFSWKKAFNDKNELEILSIEEAMPSFFIDHLLPVMNIDFLKQTIQHLNDIEKSKYFSIRINNLIGNFSQSVLIQEILESLKQEGVNVRQDSDIPEILLVPNRDKTIVIRNDWYKKGNIVIQDKASAIVVKILNPQPNDFICDMCAAPGIKTSLIAQFSNNRARIVSGEYLPERAFQTNQIFKTLHVQNTHLITADSIEFPIHREEQFDKILLDAPCTGSGTFLSNPELKWRQNENFLHQNVLLQKKLLKRAIKLLKPQGILVYSTCSLYPEEGEYQILEFLSQLKPLDDLKWTSPSYKIDDSVIAGTGRLFPSIHHTQGFFIGKFKKKES